MSKLFEETLEGYVEEEQIPEELVRVRLREDLVIEYTKKPVKKIRKPLPVSEEQAKAMLPEIMPILRQAAVIGERERKYKALYNQLPLDKIKPYIQALAKQYSEKQAKFKQGNIEVTLTTGEIRSVEPEDLINLIGIEKALVLDLLNVNINNVDAAVNIKMIDPLPASFVQKKEQISMSVRKVATDAKRSKKQLKQKVA